MKLISALALWAAIWSPVVNGAGLDNPFISVDASEKQALVKKANMLRQGDSIDRVIQLLGTPFSDDLLMRKESNELIGRSLKYYAVKLDKDLVNEKHDQLIHVFLDPDNRVKTVYVRISLE